MAALPIQLPFPVFTDADGQPVEGGYVWVGQANQDPRLNPIDVYFDKNLTIPAPRPLRTVGGYVVHDNSPAQLFIDGTDYSILVQNRKGVDIYSFPSGIVNAAGITTANWGTARTLTIGNTGKSVDGSANVSWSLAEIGAAAATHTHTVSQISDSTTVGRSVLTAVDAAAARAAIGAGTGDGDVTLSGTQTLSNKTLTSPELTGTVYINGSARSNIVDVASGTNFDLSLGNYFIRTVAGNVTFTVSNAPASRAYAFTVEITHTTGTITWFSGVVWPGGVAPVLTTNRTHLFTFVTDNGGTTWRAVANVNYTS